MSKLSLPDYLALATELQASSLSVTPSELHGLLTGMLAGGLSLTDTSWQPVLFDYTNDGQAWPSAALTRADHVLQATIAELTKSNLEFLELSLLLPDDAADASIFDVADGVSAWICHFISGLGLIGCDLSAAAVDVKEALSDLDEMARLGIDENDDLREQGQLLEQVVEHVKVCALTIHAQYGVKAADKTPPTVH